jgi:hypothetical protein
MKKGFCPTPHHPERVMCNGGEQEKGVVFHPTRRGEKQGKKQFFSPFPMRSRSIL